MTFEKETKRDIYFKQLDKELRELIDPETGELSKVVSKEIPCPLCNSERYNLIFKKRGYSFVRCNECGLVFANPQVLKEKVEKLYKLSQSNELWMEVLLSSPEIKWRKLYFEENLKFLERYFKKGKLLDIGCAIGQFMKIAKEGRWEVTGLELSDKAYKYVKETLGLSVLKCTLEQSGFEKEKFAVITMFGLLEHLPNPKQFLTEVRRVTKIGGGIIVIVPNVYSLLTMFLREKSVTFDGRNHLIYFSMDTLERLFQETGFKVLYKDTVLTGLENVLKYVQFFDPYGGDKGYKFISDRLRKSIVNEKSRKSIESLILKYNLGLRIRMIGQRHE